TVTASLFDLVLEAVETGPRIRFSLEYCSRLFQHETIERWAGYFKKVIAAIVGNPDIKISEIEILSAEEKKQVLVDFNHIEFDYPGDKTLPGLFHEQVQRTPDHIALVGAGEGEEKKRRREEEKRNGIHLSYWELNDQSDHLAGLLIEKGVLPGTIAGLMMERSIDLIIGILGILKAGGAYLPIDPELPEERVNYMLKDSGSGILLTNEQEKRNNCQCSIVNYQLSMSGRPRLGLHHSNHLAYVIYTSGSTGRPKGVPITYANLSPLLHWGFSCLGLGVKDRFLQNLAYYFDWSVWEIFIALTTGASLYMVPKELLLNPGACVAFMTRNDITVLHTTPTQYGYYLKTTEKLFTLKYLFIGAEKLNPGLVRSTFQSVEEHCRVFNMYGPTECTIISAVLEIRRLENFEKALSIPIGRAVGNTNLFILNKNLNLCPVKISGELYIAGDGVAQGYVNRPELTADKFIHFHHSSFGIHHLKLYRTGDLAKWLPDGNVEFLGRIDHQVKIRGFRIELGEIEKRLLDHAHIKEAVTVVKTDESGDKYLCAYIVSAKELDSSDLKEYLAGYLPGYMIPSYIMFIDKIPLALNGKIDREALPRPGWENTGVYVAPVNEIEMKLAEIWAEVLQIDRNRISTHDDFFALGGHSLKTITLTSVIHRELQVKIPQAEVFLNPTVRELAHYIDKAVKTHYDSIEPVEKKQYYILANAQKRLYVLHQLNPLNVAYNMPQIISLPRGFETGKLTGIFKRLINRHESLRTSFHITPGNQAVQVIHNDIDFKIEYSTGYIGDDIHHFIHSFVRPFDLSKAPLLHAGLVKCAGESYILLVDMHHIISDGVSHQVLIEDFKALYNGNELPPLRIHYKDFAEWQNSVSQVENIKRQEAYWLKEFEGDIPILNLPFDFSQPGNPSFEGDAVDFSIEKKYLEAMENIASQQGVTMYMMHLALFNVLLARLCGQEDIVIGTASAGRRHADLQRIIGMFVNTLALRNYPQYQKNFIDFLLEIKQSTLAAFENQDYPFEDLVNKVAPDRNIDRNPLFNVMFNFLEMDVPGKMPFNGYERRQAPPQTMFEQDVNASKFDLTLTISKIGADFHFSIRYRIDLFKRETIRDITHSFRELVSGVVDNPTGKIADLKILSQLEIEEEWSGLCADLENE
ncbi:MAG TPA: amino acid adenylation domain-containing protein, partial [Candidatus Deferrimicrobium sp.]|nr:amino acid adenylation domain-containing protein [Candidatus Deferrimicrobium sp.]